MLIVSLVDFVNEKVSNSRPLSPPFYHQANLVTAEMTEEGPCITTNSLYHIVDQERLLDQKGFIMSCQRGAGLEFLLSFRTLWGVCSMA